MYLFVVFSSVEVKFIQSSKAALKRQSMYYYPMEAKKPETAIVILPTIDLFWLYGSFWLPKRLPIISAIPEERKFKKNLNTSIILNLKKNSTINILEITEDGICTQMRIVLKITITITSTEITNCCNCYWRCSPVNGTGQSDCGSIVQWPLK